MNKGCFKPSRCCSGCIFKVKGEHSLHSSSLQSNLLSCPEWEEAFPEHDADHTVSQTGCQSECTVWCHLTRAPCFRCQLRLLRGLWQPANRTSFLAVLFWRKVKISTFFLVAFEKEKTAPSACCPIHTPQHYWSHPEKVDLQTHIPSINTLMNTEGFSTRLHCLLFHTVLLRCIIWWLIKRWWLLTAVSLSKPTTAFYCTTRRICNNLLKRRLSGFFFSFFFFVLLLHYTFGVNSGSDLLTWILKIPTAVSCLKEMAYKHTWL